MKRIGGLWPSLVAFDNLHAAALRAQCGKRFRPDVLLFNDHLEENLCALETELRNRTYMPGAYRTFVIYEPKRRLISAAPYRDRVVHHALCNVIEPIFEETFIASCYANRRGKGTHKALDHCVALTRRFRYCLRADIEKYFPSMDHGILKERIRRKIKCHDTLWLIDTILDHSNPQESVWQYFPGDDLLSALDRRHGLPIGNLTSQLYANVYLSQVDHAMAERCGGRRYLRYVDDFALFSNSREELVEARAELGHLLERLRLRLHPMKTQVFQSRIGVDFLGFRILPHQIRLKQENLRRARRRFRHLAADYRKGRFMWEDIRNSLQSWNAHAAYGNTWRLRQRVFGSLVFTRS